MYANISTAKKLLISLILFIKDTFWIFKFKMIKNVK